jgi:nitroreductase
MSDVMEIIFKRRSIRRYQQKLVEKCILDKLLQAAMAAPSASNNCPWEFVVVTEDGTMEKFRQRLPYGKFYAPAAIIVCANPDLGSREASFVYWVQDCSAATENILIAATGLGLGTCWQGIYPREERVQAVREILGLPEKVTPLCVIYLGYADEEKEARTQYDPVRVHWERY